MTTPIDISVVIASHKKPDYLRACLACLRFTQFSRDRFEVIVVEDGSPDWTGEFLDEFKPPYNFKTVHQPNRGRAAARNAGVAHASGRLLVMLDNDCLMNPAALDRLWEQYQAHPGRLYLSTVHHIDVRHVPGVISEIENGDLSFLKRAEAIEPEDSLYALQDLMPLVKRHLDRMSAGWVAAQGAAISIDARAFEALGGFDESIRTYGMEDFDLGFRFTQRGGILHYVEASRLYHMDHGHDRLELLSQSASSVRKFYEKHADQPETDPFLNFLIGKITFLEFNNIVARRKGSPELHDDRFDIRFSAYGMARYREAQKEESQASTLQYSYNRSQEYCLKLLLDKVKRDLSEDYLHPWNMHPFTTLPGDRILILSPHMDDEVIGCGGLIQAYRKKGAKVTIAFCTSGSGVPRRVGARENLLISQERVEESKQAAAILGVDDVIYFHLPDRRLTRAVQQSDSLVLLMEEQRFDAVYTPGPSEFHPDHRAVWRWAEAAVGQLTYKPTLILFEVWGSCRPNLFLPLDHESWKTKERAMLAYQSQLKQLDYLALMNTLATERGRLVSGSEGVGKAEAFRRIH